MENHFFYTMRRLVVLLTLLFAFFAHAADPLCPEYQFGDAGWFKTKQKACDAWAAKEQGVQGNNPSYTFRNWSHVLTETGGDTGCQLGWQFSGDSGASWSSTGMNSGFVQTRQVVCEEVCKRIEGKKVNLTIGYHATPSDNIKLNPATKIDPFFKHLMTEGGGSTCIAGCEHFMYKPDSGAKSWVSQVAGPNGLYRSSVDVSSTQFATPCSTATADAASPAAAPPACNGSTGTVNGATVCLPSTVDSGVDLGGLPTGNRGNPPAGEVPTGTAAKTDKERGEGPGGAGNGSGTGGSSNGGGASGGPATGSNNTPGGKGCNDGSKTPTPACSGKGTNDADGTVTKPATGKEQAACGAPGQPKCRIDETGTPDAVGDDKYNSKLDAYKDAAKDVSDQIKGSGNGIFDSWSLFFTAPPLASCEGFDYPAAPGGGQSMGKVDPCAVVDGVRLAMAYLWALSGLWLCLAWIKDATK